MLNPGSGFQFIAVRGFLFVCQFNIARAFFIDFGLHTAPSDVFILSGVSTIAVEFLTSVIFIDQGFEFPGIMRCGGITDRIAADQFRSLIGLDVVFVAVEVPVVLFEPT